MYYIIDAGHGKPDGGAVAADGTEEQKLNLEIAARLSALLDEMKIGHIMTRTEQKSIYSSGDTIHEKKVSDVRKRVEIANSNPDAVLISIHMNTFSDPNVSGIQVFYRNQDSKSKEVAGKLQSAFNQRIQPDNSKTVKEISSNIYLFSHIENPGVLIECGFLSNEKELANLKGKEYQNKLAQIIADVLKEHS